MNEQTELDLGTNFAVTLREFSNNRAGYTIEQLVAALETTTYLTDLTVCFGLFAPTAGDNRRIVNMLCHCVSNLRRQNEHHPLRTLCLRVVNLVENGLLDVFERFLIAAKQCGIFRITLVSVSSLPVHLLEQFCRDNNSLKVLFIVCSSLAPRGTVPSYTPNGVSQDSGTILTLDFLNLTNISLCTSTAATHFADLVAHLKVQGLLLGKITAGDGTHNDEEDDNVERTERIVSEFNWPTASSLSLSDSCQLKLFKYALDTLSTSLVILYVDIECFEYNNASAKLKILAGFLRGTLKLKTLNLRTRIPPPIMLFQALEACASVTKIQVDSDGGMDASQLQGPLPPQDHNDFRGDEANHNGGYHHPSGHRDPEPRAGMLYCESSLVLY